MAFKTGETEFTCEACGALHRVSWDRIPVRDEYHLKCQRCSATLASGKGVHDYGEPRLVG